MSQFNCYNKENPLTREILYKYLGLDLRHFSHYYYIENLNQDILLDFLRSSAIDSGQEAINEISQMFLQSNMKKWSNELKKVFQDRRDEAVFKGLILLSNDAYTVKTLVSWGYDTEVKLKDTPYSLMYEMQKFGPESNIFHINSNYQIIKFLIEKGQDKNVKDKTTIYPLETEYVKQKGVTQIETLRQYEDYISLAQLNGYNIPDYRTQYLLDGSLPFNKSFVRDVNKKLQYVGKIFTPYECAKIFKQSKKELVLKGLEDTQDVDNEEIEVYNKLKSLPLKSQGKLFLHAIKTKNKYVFDRLNEFNLNGSTPRTNVLAMSIHHNNQEWFDCITENELVNKNLSADSYNSYLQVAQSYNRHNYFIDLYNKGWTHGLDHFIDLANRCLREASKNNLNPAQYMNHSFMKIILFLAKKGHYFDNQHVVEKIALWEKEEMGKVIETIEENKSKKAFKI